VDFTSSSALGYLSAANHANEIRASYLARAAVNVGLALIAQDTRAQAAQAQSSGNSSATTAQGQPFDSYFSVWALPFPPMPVGGGTISLQVADEARKFNINSLVVTQPTNSTTPLANLGQPNLPALQQFTRLIYILDLNPDLVPSILDWLDPDSIESPNGAESDYYLGLRPPYEPRNGPMPTLGDLRLVKGVDDITFAKLSQYLTVSQETGVNPNTASPQVLACLEPELTANQKIVESIMQARSVRPFSVVTDVMNVSGASGVPNLAKDLTLRGQYFTITGVGNFAGARKIVYATFKRNPDGTGTMGSWQED
jgi:general secretion pathway protein K